MKNNFLSRGQLERTLSQRIQAFYTDRLGHRPSQVLVQLFDRELTIILENSITDAEILLIQHGNQELAKQVRHQLDRTIKPKLKELIEDILEVKVSDLLSDFTLKTGRTGIIAILCESPVSDFSKNPLETKSNGASNGSDSIYARHNFVPEI